jgi:hypothetical protein
MVKKLIFIDEEKGLFIGFTSQYSFLALTTTSIE